jgi:hypothetical protein
MPLIETNIWKSVPTMAVFIGVVIFVFIQLSHVMVNTSLTNGKIAKLQAERKLALINIDRSMQQLQVIEDEKKKL